MTNVDSPHIPALSIFLLELYVFFNLVRYKHTVQAADRFSNLRQTNNQTNCTVLTEDNSVMLFVTHVILYPHVGADKHS